MVLFSKKHVIKGLTWQTLSMGLTYAVQLLTKLILVFFLLPEHFGLIGMATVAVSLLTAYSDGGVRSALIQRKNDLTRSEHWYTAFWLNFLGSMFCFVIISVFLAPLAAWYFKQPIIRPLTIFLSLSFIWNPLGFIPDAMLSKAMDFKKLFFVNLASVLSGGIVGVTLAIHGYGVWSIAVQMVIASAVRVLVLFFLQPWRLRFVYSKTALRELFGFGIYDLLARLFGFFNTQTNILIVGYFFSPALVGAFVLANTLTIRFLNPIVSTFKKVFFPFFSGIQDDPSRIRTYYSAQIAFASFILFPIFSGLCVVSEPLCTILGEKWGSAVLPIRLLSIQGLIVAFTSAPATVYKSSGYVRTSMYLNLFKYIGVRFPLTIVGSWRFGFMGFLTAQIVSQLCISAIDFYFLKRIIDFRFSQVLREIKGTILSTVFMVLSLMIVSAMTNMKSVSELIFLILAGCVAYPTCYFLCFRARFLWHFNVLRVNPS